VPRGSPALQGNLRLLRAGFAFGAWEAQRVRVLSTKKNGPSKRPSR
jgi:hypothetical protein